MSNMNSGKQEFRRDFIKVIAFSVLIAVSLGVATWDINFWPTDTKAYYFNVAVRLPQLKYLSEMHQFMDEEGVKWLHGHEIYILSASIMQKLLRDFETLKPFLLVCIISVWFSSILVFCIARNIWGRVVGFLCYLVFITCFWPYQYIIYTGHQPLGLAFFLFALFILCDMPKSKMSVLFYILSGILMCFSLHSSIVSALYVPYYFVGFLYTTYRRSENKKINKQLIKDIVSAGLLCLLGFMFGYIYINFPNVIYNLRSYFEFVEISSSQQHFYFNQPVLIQWIAHPELPVRAGLVWVVKYFLLIMPVLFPFYIACILYLCAKCFTSKNNDVIFKVVTACLILLSLSSIILAEVRGVAQLARNYFTFLIGLIMLIGYTAYVFNKYDWSKLSELPVKKVVLGILALVGVLNIIVNCQIFFDDVYPTRMATTYMSEAINKLGIGKIYTYKIHPHRRNMVDHLNPDVFKKLRFVGINNILQPSEGYILVPPVSGNSIFRAAQTTFNDFDEDIYINELLRKGNIQDYAVASFPTLVSSRIWLHEQETLSYKTLILGHPVYKDINRTKVWLLDAGKLKRDVRKNVPSSEYVYLHKTGVRNIGTETPVYRFEGFAIEIKSEAELKGIPVRIYKVGDPKDQLIAYVYKVADEHPVWISLDEDFASMPVDGSSVSTDERGKKIWFTLPRSIALAPGKYNIVIYRTGKPDNKNFYRVYPK